MSTASIPLDRRRVRSWMICRKARSSCLQPMAEVPRRGGSATCTRTSARRRLPGLGVSVRKDEPLVLGHFEISAVDGQPQTLHIPADDLQMADRYFNTPVALLNCLICTS